MFSTSRNNPIIRQHIVEIAWQQLTTLCVRFRNFVIKFLCRNCLKLCSIIPHDTPCTNFDYKHFSFRRRSKSHASSLHSYCVSGRGGVAGESQFYDDLYLSGHLGSAPHRTLNQYSRHQAFYPQVRRGLNV